MDRLVRRVPEHGHYLRERLQAVLGTDDIVDDVRGLGMIQGVELVKDRMTKQPNQLAAAKIVFRAWEQG